uniref:Heterogeneous nuclear ribonucleoprotein M-like n=1 Tax=Sinocyclocheilus rhinocerous TaxID=307959 RepID=A0A673JR14_9TELE
MIFLLGGKTFIELEFIFFPPYRNAVNGKSNHESRKERPQKRGGGGRFEPYGNPNKRYRVFVSNIPYDVKWQTLKDLMKEKVGEVTYVEHLMDGEGKSRVSFRTEELMKKAVEKVNKHVMNGRPLKVKEDPDGVIAQRMGMGPGPGGPSMVNIPPSLMNNPNIPNEIIHGLQAGKIGSTIFVANLDYKVGWKKLKEVFGMAGAVVRADILEDKDGKSRGMGTVTFEMPLEAVQAVSMFNGQLLFNRVMHVKLDEKSLPKGDFAPPDRPPALPRGLSGVGLGLGPGGQPIDATQLNRGNSMGMDRMNSGMDRLGGGMDRMGGLDRMGMDRMDRMSDLDRLGSGFDRMGSGLDRLGPSMDRLGSGLDRMSSSVDRMGPGGFDRLGPSGMDRMSGGMDFASPMGIDRMNTGLDRMGSNFDRMGSGGGPGAGGANARKGCQIFVRNLPFDFTWKMLKDTFNSCGIVQYADIKMENGKSKGCGVVRFDSPETAERACRTMNGYRLSGREIDVRIDRNA